MQKIQNKGNNKINHHDGDSQYSDVDLILLKSNCKTFQSGVLIGDVQYYRIFLKVRNEGCSKIIGN